MTKAAILYELNAPLVVEDIDIPAPGYGQVLIKLVASGMCHSQLSEIQGRQAIRGTDPYLPHTLGHEGAGVIEAIGPGVTRVAVGDHVLLYPSVGAGINAQMPTYYHGKQRINAGAANSFMECTLASENHVIKIRDDMPFDKASVLGCAVATGAGTVINVAKVEHGSTVVVFGAGGIGLCSIQAAGLMNAARVIAVDIHEHKLKLAQTFGATHAINARNQDPVAAIEDLTDGKGADYVIEAAGTKETMEQAFASVRRFGGLAVIMGNIPFQHTISINPFELIAGKRIVGSWIGETIPERDFPYYIDLYLTGKLKLDELITHRFRLEDINDAFHALEKGEVGRAIIEL